MDYLNLHPNPSSIKSISKIAIATTGGDAPGMNACIRAIYKTASKKWTPEFPN